MEYIHSFFFTSVKAGFCADNKPSSADSIERRPFILQTPDKIEMLMHIDAFAGRYIVDMPFVRGFIIKCHSSIWRNQSNSCPSHVVVVSLSPIDLYVHRNESMNRSLLVGQQFIWFGLFLQSTALLSPLYSDLLSFSVVRLYLTSE